MYLISPTISIGTDSIVFFCQWVDSIPRWHHGKILPCMNVIVVQSEGAVKFYPSPKGSSSRQEIINLLLMAARTLKLILLHVFVCADVANYAAVWIIVGDLLGGTILIHYHAIISHIVLDVIVPAIDCAIGILQLRQAMTRRTGFVDAFYYVV